MDYRYSSKANSSSFHYFYQSIGTVLLNGRELESSLHCHRIEGKLENQDIGYWLLLLNRYKKGKLSPFRPGIDFLLRSFLVRACCHNIL
jgi:hypothetical protein